MCIQQATHLTNFRDVYREKTFFSYEFIVDLKLREREREGETELVLRLGSNSRKKACHHIKNRKKHIQVSSHINHHA